ncbi:MAG: flagellar biosynthetic protein FliR, partial [Deltaproteobacteria bacterium]|nr:flagellar biosynthetic protein FliR [Deltaproteobacteria bacterium]
VVLHAVSGLSGTIIPGSFVISDFSIDLLIDRTAHIFKFAVILSAPVIVALMLTNFVMGLVTKAVPTVNIFIVSFPLTIGIGLILMGLALPDMAHEVERQIAGIEIQVNEAVQDTQRVPLSPSAPSEITK